ncbi:glucan endo-1-3-beta-glucosidase btgC [Penicillium verhagenii]|uniref:glucan endo-1-3-beta-glucosidase btgC n=1 Tax=Penicillium verhagenii TaxID=1562060 RepID=UPI002545B500|nr:glucan endo-1-3-beta-glucosidase btgC [Penicillium verhagenii]KAJ5947390.1 glucan endo-1-3-beta-glucosidase btgC [Penicillium verhagenii]
MNPPNSDIPEPPRRYSNTHIYRQDSSVTPGVDNLGPSSIGGGISGIAIGVANTHSRQSGIHAMNYQDNDLDGYTGPAERGFNATGSDNPYVPVSPDTGAGVAYGSAESFRAEPQNPFASGLTLGDAATPPAIQTPQQSSVHLSEARRSFYEGSVSGAGAGAGAAAPGPYGGNGNGGLVNDGPYQRQSQYSTGRMSLPVDINPDEIADDGDDEFGHGARAVATGAGAGAGAAAGAHTGFFGGFFGTEKNAGVSYDSVPGGGLEAGQGGKGKKAFGMQGRKKRGLIVGAVLGLIILAAIIGGAVGGTLGSRHDGSNSSSSASDDEASNGVLDKNSAEIKALMGNKNLHKVFPGMDYTPWGVQYPLCLKYPPSQNNVTRDLAVLSQLTNNVRLYGTDCNQTEMTLTAIDKLGLTDMKVWLGVWIDSNTTTTNRQINQLYDILDANKNTSIFNGVIVGNEALYRAGPDIATAETNLITYITDVRDEVKKRSTDMLIATSDLGDNWNAKLVEAVDVVMSNVHPFFAGVNVDVAAAWTWDFWQTHDVVLTSGTTKKQVISEVGWPSDGGKDCGSSPTCDSDTPGSVASIDNMNTFMSDWVCQALENGTDYFWFEAFDEPWKIQYNTPGKDWEDKWGLMDSARNIKSGLKIPDCGGKTAS